MKGLENQATRLSGEARDESKMADGMLKDIANMERDIPSSLKVSATGSGSSFPDLSVESLTPPCSPIMLRSGWAPWLPGWTG